MNIDDLDNEWGTRMALRQMRDRSILRLINEAVDLDHRFPSDEALKRILKRQHLLRSELHRRATSRKATWLGVAYPDEF